MTFWKTCIITFILIFITSTALAESYIGIILEGYEENCQVKSKSIEYRCSENRMLLENDVVIKKPDIEALKIKWAPYADSKKVSKTTLQVVFNPPKSKKGVLEKLMESLGFIKKEHEVFVAATRGGQRILQPCDNATVISGGRIPFIWEGKGERIVFKDSKGIEIFRKELKDESSIQLTPEEIGMKPSEVYTWNIEGSTVKKPFRVQLLSDEITVQIIADLKKIDNEKISDTDKRIKKSAYLQFMSDTYPKEIDLYWLSYKVLTKNIDEKGASIEEEKALMERFRKHCREKLFMLLNKDL